MVSISLHRGRTRTQHMKQRRDALEPELHRNRGSVGVVWGWGEWRMAALPLSPEKPKGPERPSCAEFWLFRTSHGGVREMQNVETSS